MFGGELSREAQALIGQIPLGGEGPACAVSSAAALQQQHRRARHGHARRRDDALEMLAASGDALRAMYIAGSFLPSHLEGQEDALSRLDFLVVQELFETETTAGRGRGSCPPRHTSEQEGTFTNNDGLVQACAAVDSAAASGQA
jgi:hypothetical protein